MCDSDGEDIFGHGFGIDGPEASPSQGNPYLHGANTQERCRQCRMILFQGLCLDCGDGPAALSDDEPQADDWYSGDRGGMGLFDFSALEEQLSAAVASPQATRGWLEGREPLDVNSSCQLKAGQMSTTWGLPVNWLGP